MSNQLFTEFDLHSTITNIERNLQLKVKGIDSKKILLSEDELIHEFVEEYKINVPKLILDKKEVSVIEANISVARNSRNTFLFNEGHAITQNGLKIEVKIPFEGDGSLFRCRASTWSISGTPDGRIFNNTLVLTYETTEKDPDKIKSVWQGDIAQIQKNLEWIKVDVEKFNGDLEGKIKSLILNRKKEAEANQLIIDALRD
jgi:hypothetical protein